MTSAHTVRYSMSYEIRGTSDAAVRGTKSTQYLRYTLHDVLCDAYHLRTSQCTIDMGICSSRAQPPPQLPELEEGLCSAAERGSLLSYLASRRLVNMVCRNPWLFFSTPFPPVHLRSRPNLISTVILPDGQRKHIAVHVLAFLEETTLRWGWDLPRPTSYALELKARTDWKSEPLADPNGLGEVVSAITYLLRQPYPILRTDRGISGEHSFEEF